MLTKKLMNSFEIHQFLGHSTPKFAHYFVLLLMVPIVSSEGTIESCIVPADPDILGLGVRLGLYFQITSNVILYIRWPREAVRTLTVSNMLLTGFLITIVTSIVYDGFPPGAMVAASSLLRLDFSSFIPILFSWEEDDGLSIWSYLACLLRLNGIVGLYIWFWFHGVGVANESQCMEPRVFLLANLGAYGGVRTVFKVYTIGTALLVTAWNSISAYILYECVCHTSYNYETRWSVSAERILRVLSKADHFLKGDAKDDVSTLDRIIDGLQEVRGDERNARFCRVIHAAYATITVVVIIFVTEISIKWNKLKGISVVSSGSQIIPLTVGSYSLIRSVWLVFMSRKIQEKKKVNDVQVQTPDTTFSINGQEIVKGGIILEFQTTRPADPRLAQQAIKLRTEGRPVSTFVTVEANIIRISIEKLLLSTYELDASEIPDKDGTPLNERTRVVFRIKSVSSASDITRKVLQTCIVSVSIGNVMEKLIDRPKSLDEVHLHVEFDRLSYRSC